MSNSEEGIRCRCGKNIRLRDLLQMILGMVEETPAFVYVKFRCPECQREEWRHVSAEELTACFFESEESSGESASFDKLGDIDLDEIIDFHEALEQLTPADLADLAPEEA